MARSEHERRRDHRCRTVLATTSEPCLILDADGTVLIMNEAAEALFSRPRTEVVGRDIGALEDPELTRKVRAILTEGPEETVSFWVTDLDRRLSCRLAPYSQDGEPGAVLSVRDDSELFREQERAAAILASTGDGLVVLSLDDIVTYVNPAACEMLACSPQDLLGRQTSIDALLSLEPVGPGETVLCWETRGCRRTECPAYGQSDPRCWLLSGTRSLDGHESSFVEKQTVCANCEVFRTNRDLVPESGMPRRREVPLGETAERVARVTTNPVVDHGGRYVGTVTTIADVTMEREIGQMKTEFVSTVSHELRTPLTSIKGYIDLVLEGEAGDLTEAQEEFLGIVKDNSDRLVVLINDLLDISRIESGRVVLKIEPVDLGDTLADSVGTFRAVLDAGDIGLEVALPDDLPRVAADRVRVGQVVTNLVSNAVKYSPDGGTITVSARVEVGEVVLSVTDTGIGIGEEDQESLFAKFYRVDSSYTREVGGTGLGLAICKSIVELLGGRIWVESTLGAGSTFSFSLPVAPTGLVRTPEVEAPTEVTGGTVLVVDGEEHIANLIETYLGRRGYDVVKAGSGREAIELVERLRPDAITLDVMLEDMDGFDLLQRLKKDPATADIPVVVLSVVCDEGKSCRLGAADYIEKPIDPSRLVGVIDGVVGAMEAPIALVVDDDERVVEALSGHLRDKGFAVLAAHDGEEAMAAITGQRPDLVLLDLEMPVMDGYEVMRRVKTGADTRDIPIVVMTDRGFDDSVDALGLAAGQLSKPFDADPVVESIERLLSGASADSPDARGRG